jgi:hypothetical protein
VVAVLRDEPPERVARMLTSIVGQVGVTGLEVVLAAPPGDRALAAPIEPSGAVGSIQWVDNEGGGRSAGLNAAVAAASAPIVVRIDARSAFGEHHVRRCIELLADPARGIVGGAQVAEPEGSGTVAAGIARSLRNPLLSGGAAYRETGRSGAVDTVYLGAYRRDVFDDLGGYEVRLRGNEDFDLCQRAVAAGLVVWLDADLAVAYHPRSSLGAVARQYFDFGRTKVDYWRLRGARPRPRQLVVPLAQAVAVLGVPTVLRHLRGAAVAGAAAVAALSALDARGGPARPQERAVSVATAIASSMSFGAGVWAGCAAAVVGGRRRSAEADGTGT